MGDLPFDYCAHHERYIGENLNRLHLDISEARMYLFDFLIDARAYMFEEAIELSAEELCATVRKISTTGMYLGF